MQTIEKQVSTGVPITLDDKNFVNCEFTRCRLMYSGGDFALTDTKLQECQFTFMGAAQRTVSLLAAMGALKPGDPIRPVGSALQ